MLLRRYGIVGKELNTGSYGDECCSEYTLLRVEHEAACPGRRLDDAWAAGRRLA